MKYSIEIEAGGFGCETGCCGDRLYSVMENGEREEQGFRIGHTEVHPGLIREGHFYRLNAAGHVWDGNAKRVGDGNCPYCGSIEEDLK